MKKPILKAGRNCWAMSPVQETGLLVDGRDYYSAFYHAAKKARRYILLAGWQFDSGVPLLRGRDSHGIDGEVTLLAFLNKLCERNRRLRVCLLAWDFNLFYLLKREFLQAWWFNWKSNERVQFRFDSSHPLGACHHQKFAVIDGTVTFVGGMDLCWGFWDDRQHRARHRYRINADKKCYTPRHDVHSYHTGPLAARLTHLFQRRWHYAGGPQLKLPQGFASRLSFAPTYPIPARRVAVSRTVGKTIRPARAAISEIRRLYEDAIDAAEEFIYIENQYFSSHAVNRALIKRMKALDRPRLRIVIILPRQPFDFIEEIGLGSTQARLLRSLTRVAARTRHTLGIYNSRAAGKKHRQITYIHSKVMLVDDQFLTIGSANLSNRSMGFDTELNVSWQATGPNAQEIMEAIRAIRVGLLAEHAGLRKASDVRRLAETEGLVAYLNTLAEDRRYRLCHHRINTSVLSDLVTAMTPHELIIDPKRSHLAERFHAFMTRNRKSVLAKGAAMLSTWL